jgi:hypothetical protein
MKAKDMKLETAVVVSGADRRRGTVIGNKISKDDELVAVEWSNGEITKINVNRLIPAPPSVEEAYEAIKSAMSAAISSLKTANELADKHSVYLSEVDYDLMQEFNEESNNIAWAPSQNC